MMPVIVKVEDSDAGKDVKDGETNDSERLRRW